MYLGFEIDLTLSVVDVIVDTSGTKTYLGKVPPYFV